MDCFQNVVAGVSMLIFNYVLRTSEAATEIVCDVDGTFRSLSHVLDGPFLFLQSEV